MRVYEAGCSVRGLWPRVADETDLLLSFADAGQRKMATMYVVEVPDDFGEAFLKSGLPHTVDGLRTFSRSHKLDNTLASDRLRFRQ
jgi:hypothetical protein